MNGAESLVTTAIAAGTEVCFANFGTSELTLVAALDAIPGIRPVQALFEGVCTGAADGYGRMRDKPAMTLLHLGVGLSNGLANLHNAKRARTPVLNIVGEHATWHQRWDSPERTDIRGLALPVSDWVKTCESADTVSQDTADAISASLRGQVAVLIVPQDSQWGECEPQSIIRPQCAYGSMDEARVRRAAEALRSGTASLLLLGGRALRPRGLLAAARIKASTGCDILAETFAGRIERGAGLPGVDRLPYFPQQAIERLSRYQSVVLAGSRDPVATFAYRDGRSRFLRDDQAIFTIADTNHDLEEVLDFMADLVSSPGQATAPTGLEEPLNRPTVPHGRLTAETACRTLAALQPEGAIIVDEAVTSGGTYDAFSKGAPPHTLLTVTGGAIGQGMPCALGAAIACPDRPVINLQADGSAMYTVQALWTQAREGLDVTTLLCANRSYDILKIEMARSGHVPLGSAAQALTDLGSPDLDWVNMSKGMGVPAASVETSEDLARELTRALEEPGPHLIEMVLTR